MGSRRYSAASRHEVLLDEDEFSASFTTACDSPGTLKSISCSSFRPTNTSLSAPVRSSSTCLGVNTQRVVDSCPHTGLPVLDNWVLVRFVGYLCCSFHHNRFRDTTSWECIAEDDCVRSCLIELQSFSLSKLYFDPIHRIMAFSTFACTMQDVVGSNEALADLCDSYAWDSRL